MKDLCDHYYISFFAFDSLLPIYFHRELQRVLKANADFPSDRFMCKTRRPSAKGLNKSNSSTNFVPPIYSSRSDSNHFTASSTYPSDQMRRTIEWPYPIFDILNLVDSDDRSSPFADIFKQPQKIWKVVGNITRNDASLNSITYMRGPMADLTAGPYTESKHNFRVVTGIAPPFVHLSTKLDNGTCLTGTVCLEVSSS